MALPFYNWSRTAASNATADSTVNWAEGQAPSSVNDSARAMMASTAAFRDDIAGAIVTGGTSTAYTVSSNQVFDSLAHLQARMIAFTPHATNTGACTLDVDGLGAKPLVSAPDVALQAGTLILGTPYLVTYRSDFSTPSFVLHGFYGNAYNIPLAGGMDFWGTTVPNSAFAFPIGQAISRTTYSALFAIMSTTYGVGDGSTTFNLPDRRGRVSAQLDSTGTILTSATMTPDGNTLGSKGGAQSSALGTSNLPAYTPSGSISNGAITFPVSRNTSTANGAAGAIASGPSGGSSASDFTGLLLPSQATTTFTGTAQGGTSAAFTNVQPTIACNYILRII